MTGPVDDLPGSVAWWRFLAARYPEYEPNVARAIARDRAAFLAAVARLRERYIDLARTMGEALRPAVEAAATSFRTLADAFSAAGGVPVVPPE